MEKSGELRPSDSSIEVRYRTDKEGYSYGEWSTGVKEQSLSDTLHVKSKAVTVDITTDYGGPESKYENKNEDVFLTMVEEERFLVSVIDGAGGSGQGRKAAQLAAEALAHIYRRSPEGEFSKMIDATDKHVGGNANSGFAPGVVIRGKRVGDAWTIDLAGLGDCKVMTVRAGEKLPEGTTPLQNMAAMQITLGGKPEEYYTNINQNRVFGGFGLYERQPMVDKPDIRSFQGQADDQLVAASDGFWDLVSEYEVIELSKQYRGRSLQEQLYTLAHRRNNSTGPFVIQHDEKTSVTKEFAKMHPDFVGKKCGDNITIAVIELLPTKGN